MSEGQDTTAIRAVRACPCCGSEQLRARFEVRHVEDDPLFAWTREAEYTRAPVALCRACGFVFKSMQPAKACDGRLNGCAASI